MNGRGNDQVETRQRHITVAAVGLLGLAVYATTLFPGVGGILNHGDSAKFQFLGAVTGIGHSPGNPLYLLLLTLIQQVPLGSAALRANLLSACLGAGTLMLVANMACRIAGRTAAWMSAVTLGLGSLFWEFATEAEVYALAGFMVALVAYWLTRAELESTPAFLILAGSTFVLGLANHLGLGAALPALAAATFMLWHIRPPKPGFMHALPLVGAALITAGLYGALPLVHQVSAYSEYPRDGNFEDFYNFATGQRWHGQLQLGSLRDALGNRSMHVLKPLLRQWALPLWLCAPLALVHLARRTRALAAFLAIAAASWTALIFLYDIPDPDGLAVPIAVCIAPAFGVAIATANRPLVPWLAGLLLLTLTPTAVLHLQRYQGLVGFEILEDVVRPRGKELLDLPDIIQRIPDHAYLTLPCYHYGCAQVGNYHRFADGAVEKRGIELVTLKGGRRPPWDSSPPVVDPAQVRDRAICTIHPRERRLLRPHGGRLTAINRPAREINGQTMTPMPVHCSMPVQ